MVENTSCILKPSKGIMTAETDMSEFGTTRINIDGCMLLMVESGCAIASIRLKRSVMKSGMVFLLFYDDIFWIECRSRTFSCRYLALTYENVDEAIFKLTSHNFWDSLSEINGFHLDTEQRNRLESWYSQMQWVCAEVDGKHCEAILRNNIHNLLVAMDYEMESMGIYGQDSISSGRTLVLKFMKLLPQYGRHNRSVSFYADKLCITTTYLNRLSHKWLNASPKELIGQQTISEIKTLLATTDMSVKEIASLLHFDDSPYMCRYFRHRTGLSPMEYRKGLKKS